MRSFFSSHIREVQNDSHLRFYGAMVSLFSVLSGFKWIEAKVAKFLSSGSEIICWPFFTNCGEWRVFSSAEITFFIYSFITISFLTAGLFLFRRFVSTAYVLLFFLTLVKLVFLAMDYRLRLNQHIMAFWVALAFLFFPQKKQTIPIVVVLFYFFAGTLKLNQEWLSGFALNGRLWLMDGTWRIAACYYVVVLELVLIWGLLVEKKWINWAVFFQLLLFHLFSYPLVGFFYPLLMLAMITIFPIHWHQRQKFSLHWSSIGFLVLFISSQLPSRMIPGDTALTGEGRLFSLHMFDANTICEPRLTLRFSDKPPFAVNQTVLLAPRIRCDPAVYFGQAKALCRSVKKDNPSFIDLDLALKSRRWSDKEFKNVIDSESFCSKNLDYSLFGMNDWISRI